MFPSRQNTEIATHVLQSFPKHAPPQRLLPASHNPCFNVIFVDSTNFPCVLWCTFPFPMEKLQKKGHVPSPPRESDSLVLADT